MNSRGLRFLLLVLSEENAGLYYFNSSSLSFLQSIEADTFSKSSINPSRDDKLETFTKSPGNPVRDDRREALQYIFCHKVDDELSRLVKEYPVPLFVMGTGAMLIRFGRWIRHLTVVGGLR